MGEKRSLLKHFLNTTPSSTATFNLLGSGINELAIDYSPKTTTEQDITQDTANSDVTGYEPKASVTMKFKSTDAAFIYLDSIRTDRKILSDAETDLVNVDIYKTAEAGAYPAEKQRVAIAITNYGGAAGDMIELGFDILYKGDATKGTFNPTTKTFTAS